MVRTAQLILALDLESNGSQSRHVRTVRTAQLIVAVESKSKGSHALWPFQMKLVKPDKLRTARSEMDGPDCMACSDGPNGPMHLVH